MLDVAKFSENLKKMRKEREMSQRDLADKLFVSMQSVSKWEKGISIPDIEHLCAISDMFDVTLDEMLCTKKSCPAVNE